MKNILLVHGFNGIPKIFLYFEEELKEKGYNVIIPDFPTKADITLDGYLTVFAKYKNYFDENLIVIAHSLGNAMLLKYLCINNLKIKGYISLAGFGEAFTTIGREDLNIAIRGTSISQEEKDKITFLIKNKYSIYSNDDHIVPYYLLENFPKLINSKPLLIPNIGHMGKKSGLESLPEVLDIVETINR